MLQKLYNLRYWLSWIVLGVAAAAIVYWGFVYEANPRTVRLAVTGEQAWHGRFADALKRNIERQTDYRVQLQTTASPNQSRSRIQKGNADVAVFHPGAPAMAGMVGVAPLWDEYVQVLVRTDAAIDTVGDLAGRSVALGAEDSANRDSARQLLEYFGVETADLEDGTTPLSAVAEEGSVDAAVVTRSLNDPDLRTALRSGDYELLSLPAVAGFVFNHPHFRGGEIPAGVYPTPGAPLPTQTLASPSRDAILAGRSDLHEATVETLLRVLESTQMRASIPDLATDVNPRSDTVWQLMDRHAATERYFAGQDTLGTPADLLDSMRDNAIWLALLLLLVVIAVVQWRRQYVESQQRQLHGVKRELERMFQELFKIEGAQREARDVRVLQEHLNELNQVKMKAVKITLGTDLGESSLFLAFLQQARAVSEQIEWRLSMAASPQTGGGKSRT